MATAIVSNKKAKRQAREAKPTKAAKKTDLLQQIRKYCARYKGLNHLQYRNTLDQFCEEALQDKEAFTDLYARAFVGHARHQQNLQYTSILNLLKPQGIEDVEAHFRNAWQVEFVEPWCEELERRAATPKETKTDGSHRVWEKVSNLEEFPMPNRILLPEALTDAIIEEIEQAEKHPEIAVIIAQILELRERRKDCVRELQKPFTEKLNYLMDSWNQFKARRKKELEQYLSSIEAIKDMKEQGVVDLFSQSYLQSDTCQQFSNAAQIAKKNQFEEELEEGNLCAYLAAEHPKLADAILTHRDLIQSQYDNQSVVDLEHNIELLEQQISLLQEGFSGVWVENPTDHVEAIYRRGDALWVHFKGIYKGVTKKGKKIPYTLKCTLYEWRMFGKPLMPEYRDKHLNH